MKNLFTTIAIGLTMLSAKANHFSALNLKMFDNGSFSVVLDNQPSYQSTIFSAAKIQPGYHKLKVIRFVPCPNSYAPMKKVIYNGWINIPAKAVMYAQINCHSQLDVVKIVPLFSNSYNGWGYGNGWDEDDDDYGYNSENGYGNGTNCGYEGNGNAWGAPQIPQMPTCMSQMEFMQMKGSIESKSFESSKLQIAKQVLAQNYFSSAQVADLMSVFDFETSKVDFAKSAYGRVIDKQNYYLVNNAFSFESSIQDLNQYIAGK